MLFDDMVEITGLKEIMESIPQSPKHHAEGSIYHHSRMVAELLPDTADYQAMALFHDLGKIDTLFFKESDKGIKIQTIGHEDLAVLYIHKYKDVLSDYSINWRMVQEVCQYHMRMHLYLDGAIKKDHKRKLMELLDYFDALTTFSKADNKGRIASGGKPILILTIGIPGSGKSTWARQYSEKTGYVRVCPDDIRKEITGEVSNISRDSEVWAIAKERVNKLLDEGTNVIFDSTMMNSKTLTTFKMLSGKAIVCYKVFNCSSEEAKKRISLDISNNVDRSKVPEHIVDKMYSNYDSIVQSLDKRFIIKEQH